MKSHVVQPNSACYESVFDEAVPDDNDASNGIVRFDLKLSGPSARGKPREVWLDHAIVQETCPRDSQVSESQAHELN